MKYFEDFISSTKDKNIGNISVTNNYESAKIIKDDEEIFIQGRKNINRVFNNDLVEFTKIDNNFIVINQIDNCIKDVKILGILQIKTKTIIGINKKGIPIYIFKPFDKNLPNFYVSSNYLKKNCAKRNIYVAIKFHKWETSSLYPNGICEEVLGEIGNLEEEKNLIFNIHNLDNTSYKNKEIIEIKRELDYDTIIENNDKFHDNERIDLTDKNIFSIDPKGCEDIDDCIHIEKNGEDDIIGVHIADVSSYIPEDTLLDLKARERISTIYLNKIIDMIPPILSTDIASLKPGLKKRAVSIIYIISPDGEIKNITYHRSFIKSKKALSYETADLILEKKIDTKISFDLLFLKGVVSKFSNRFLGLNKDIDSHSLIETLMIMTNCSIAEILFKRNPNNTLLRIHDGINLQKWDIIKDKIKNIDNDIINKIKILYTNSAKYTISKNIDNESPLLHSGLNKKFYTHFTSPIRRYIDIIIHRMLLNNFNKSNEFLESICKKVNEYQLNIKKAERDYEKLCILEKILDIKVNNIEEDKKEFIKEAVIIDIQVNNLTVFIPSLKMTHNMRIFSKKLDHIINYDLENNRLKISNKHNKNIIELNLFQNLELKINAMPYADSIKKKIETTIINPDIQIILN